MLIALHHQGKRATTEGALMSSSISPVVPEVGAYLAPLFAPRPVKRREMVEAASWAAVGVHIPRDRGWPGWAAAFYARRAVALARLGRFSAAAVCCRRAEASVDSGDRLTPAWLAWARGLIALAQGDRDAAEQCLARAEHLFKCTGDRQSARQLAADLGRREVGGEHVLA